MFAKVFGQIFDSSIAEDYNCRRMFMDLLVLADPTGAIDMTLEAISRRTNVPLEQVTRYISELCQPDAKSRSDLHEGKRLIPLDSRRDWGWQIVNYLHYRKLRDQEALRSYFRDAQRRRREKNRAVKDAGLTDMTKIDTNGQSLTPSSSSTSCSSSKSRCTQKEAEDFCVSIGLPKSDGEAMFLHWTEKGWAKVKDWKATIRKWKSFGYMPSQKRNRNRFGPTGKLPAPSYPKLPPHRDPSDDELERARVIAKQEADKLRQQLRGGAAG